MAKVSPEKKLDLRMSDSVRAINALRGCGRVHAEAINEKLNEGQRTELVKRYAEKNGAGAYLDSVLMPKPAPVPVPAAEVKEKPAPTDQPSQPK
jgi:hypothetical protein